MSRTLVALGVFLAACAGSHPSPRPISEPPGSPAGRPAAAAGQPETSPGDPRAPHREVVLKELEVVDRELDAIDEELAASAIVAPPSRDAAIALATARIQALQRITPETLAADTPPLLVRIANDYAGALAEDARLAKDLGPRHLDRIEQKHVIDALRARFDRQREIELAEATAWRDELGKLTRPSTAAKLRQASRRALQAALGHGVADAIVPSDAPAEVRVAALLVDEAMLRVDLATPILGPKHPEMIALHAELSAVRDAFHAAASAADAALAREIAALDAPRARPAVDPARLARRAELAARSRDLRREWDASR